MTEPPRTGRFAFAVAPRLAGVVRLFGAGDGGAWVEVDDALFTVRFGPWILRTPVENLAGAEETGPFTTAKVVGVHLSLADRGITFGTNAERGVCVRFRRPVPAIDPLGLIRHPGATVTVADGAALVRAVTARVQGR